MDKRNNTPVVLVSFWRNIQLQYIKLNIFEMGKALHGEYEDFNMHVI